MAGFNGFLDATFLPPRNWTLDADLSYQCDTISQDEINLLRECKVRVTDDGNITVPAGYVTDLASVPRAAWAVISPFDVARAAVIHDLLYEYINTQYKTVNESAAAEDGPATKKEREVYRKIADHVFKVAMKNSEPPVPTWKIFIAWSSVRVFGRWAINSSAPRHPKVVL
jgi:hypothetical protein